MTNLLAKYLEHSLHKSKWFIKDYNKAAKATKFIGRGSERSSTESYRKAAKELANSSNYSSEDTVFISAEGNRLDRVSVDWVELDLALNSKATIITDTVEHRSREYNIGEREVAEYLLKNNYHEITPGIWKSKEKV